MKFLYPIKKLNIKTWIKYWLLKKTSGSKVLSELIEGTSPITIENAYKGTSLQELVFKGQTIQDGTPTPEAPIPVQTVKEDNTITINEDSFKLNLKGKNFLNPFVNYSAGYSTTERGVTFTINQDGTITANGTATGGSATLILYGSWSGTTVYQTLDKTKNYCLPSLGNKEIIFVRTYDSGTFTTYNSNTQRTISNKENIVYFGIEIANGETVENYVFKPQLEEGLEPSTYEPYYNYELCKIGDYQDSIYYENNKWYIEKNIGKVVLNGTETWGGTPNYYTTIIQNLIAPTPATERIIALSNNFLVQGYDFKSSNNLYFHPNKNLQIENPNASYYATVNDWKTWLSTHNTTVYYVLATPTYTEITDTTLISQLEAIKNATLISGTNEITQTPSDLPFILNFKYYMKG